MIWSSGSVRCGCAGWVAGAASRRAYPQLFRAERACLRLAGARRIKLGVGDIETGARARAPLALTRQAVPRQPAPQIPQVPGGGARAAEGAPAKMRLMRAKRAAEVRFKGALLRTELCASEISVTRIPMNFPPMRRAMEFPLLTARCRFTARCRSCALQVDRDKPAPCASAPESNVASSS